MDIDAYPGTPRPPAGPRDAGALLRQLDAERIVELSAEARSRLTEVAELLRRMAHLDAAQRFVAERFAAYERMGDG